MPYIETPSDLADKLADWLGIYGGCRSDGDEGCEFNANRPLCCRQGFVDALEERIRQSVVNEQVINNNQ